MNVLYLSHKPIFPVVDGGCFAMLQFWKCLTHLDYKVSHVCIATEKHPFNLDNYSDEFKEKSAISSVTIQTEPTILGALKHLISRKSYITSRFHNEKVEAAIIEKLGERTYDYIILESLFSALHIETIRKHSKAKVFIRTHNVENKIWFDLSRNSANIFKSWYVKILASDLKAKEIEILNKADKLLAISIEDQEEFKEIGIKTSSSFVPVAIGQSEFEYIPTSDKICFLGSMNWKPNVEAAEILVNEILPSLRKLQPTLELHIAGSNMENQFPTSKDLGIINHGFVNDSKQFLSSHGIFVAPIKSGSGVKIKVLEALACGVPSVISKDGAKGIPNENSFIIVSTNSEFVSQISRLLNSFELQKEFSIGSKRFMDENYSIISVSKMLKSGLES